MAMYHFRLKSDKKPNGTKISAVKHVEYINREGAFSDDEHDKGNDKFVGNFITTEKSPKALDGQNILLYKTNGFGLIRNTERGIEVTENASETTIATALLLAAEIMNHQPLIINGSPEFKKEVLKTAILQDLPISFDDLLMQREFMRNKFIDYPERKKLAVETAHKILERMEQKQIDAQAHVEYINRERAFEKRGECIFHAHRLPKWAKNDPKKFFQAADKYEGKGNRRYMEIEFALPNELKTMEQYRQIIDAFIAKHLSEHYYAYAVHNKIGVMSDGQHHPHVHIMFSERLIDDVEKKKERAACNFFKYPARRKKDGSEPSFEERRKRGAPKNRNWSNKNFLTVLRADFAQIQNEVLEQNGYSIRVDHRSLEAQKEEAQSNGDTILARLFSRVPEKYIGVISCQENDEPRLERLKIFRGLRKQHFDMMMKMDALTKEADELEVKDIVQVASVHAKELMDSKEYTAQKFVSQELVAMRNKMMTAVSEVNKWKHVIISQHDAEEQARLEYMSKAERELWKRYFETLGRKKQLEEFLKTLKKPDEKYKEELKAYEELVRGVYSKIFSLLTSARAMKKSVEDIRRRLEEPEYRNNILLITHQILQANTLARKMLKRASEELDKAVDDLRNALFTQTIEEPQTSFKTREVYDLIRQQYRALKKEHEDLFVEKFHLQRQVISPERAVFMAKNIFVHGDYKRLREEMRRYKKAEQCLAQKFQAYAKEEKDFQMRDWSVFPRSTFLPVQYYLTKQRTLLELERNHLDQINFSLQNKQVELETLCRQPDAAKKIEEIATGILRKNLRFVRQLEKVDNRDKEIIQRMNHAKEQMKALENRIVCDKVNTRYRVTCSDTLPNSKAASLIADAILFDPQAVQLVARFGGDNLEMEKDWEMMSEFDKDEIIRKKIIREL
ncbi:MobA/MobL family protein [Candidatus Saccharibacteria bacterium]|nr:MobA/MobL family protein [Candidatus Saccharibacteria bacterium]